MNSSVARTLSYVLIAVLSIGAYDFFFVPTLPDWSGKTIVVSLATQDMLAETFRRSWQRDPDAGERQDLIGAYVKEEMAFRTGMLSGYGSSDISVRRRVQELLEESARASALAAVPADVELLDHLNINADRFRVDQIITFRQVYFDIDANSIGADASARFMLGKLRREDMPDDLSTYGDPTVLPSIFVQVDNRDISRYFGASFVSGLQGIETGKWSEPIRSSEGLHLVHIDARSAGRVPQLDEVREEVLRDLLEAKAADAVEKLYESLGKSYDVVIE